jgi:hypothetical protein
MNDRLPSNPVPLVYGEIHDGLVFIPVERAEELIESGDPGTAWPAQEMRGPLPADLLTRYGEVRTSLLDGDFVSIALGCEDELVTELEARGWSCERDDTMVLEASGYD